MAGADEYVMKPFDSDTLIAKLQSLGIATPLDLDPGLS
jgi:DNA-binding response OmpR family regulator